MSIGKYIYRFFSASNSLSWGETIRAEKRGYAIARTLIHAFYVFLLYYALPLIDTWNKYSGTSLESFDLLWPVFWIQYTTPELGSRIILLFAFSGFLLGPIFCTYRIVRIWIFLGLLEYLALKYSFGKIGHSMHLWLIVSFIFTFLPNRWDSPSVMDRVTRQITLRLFWGAQTFILMTYTMAGLGKLGGAIYQISVGQHHIFHPDAMALHIADRLLQTHSSSILGNWTIEHAFMGWLMLLYAVYIQTFSIWAAFRPSLHKIWAAHLMFFHISVALTLSINFHPSVFLIGLFFLYSPFQPEHFSLSECLRELPLFGLIFKKMLKPT